jgi:4-alpha-glucanotransferase
MLLGDLPIYVSGESVDVWANQSQFVLNDQRRPSVVSGAPPDPFCVDGQLWANPLYDWDGMREDGYRWWKRRFARAFARTDVVRVDHFRGFSAYWEVPAEAETAVEGQWVKGPGEELFAELRAHFAEFPIVVEDLGDIDEPARDLARAVGAPGMRVLSFAFNGDADSEHLPIHYDANVVCYTGTHDTNTLLGWWTDVDDTTRDHVRRFLGIDGHDVVWDLIRAAMSSVANWAVIPMQDLLALGGEARMNLPGSVQGNWGWRLPGREPAASVAHRLRDLSDLYGRSVPR